MMFFPNSSPSSTCFINSWTVTSLPPPSITLDSDLNVLSLAKTNFFFSSSKSKNSLFIVSPNPQSFLKSSFQVQYYSKSQHMSHSKNTFYYSQSRLPGLFQALAD